MFRSLSCMVGCAMILCASALVNGQDKKTASPSKALPGLGVADPAGKVGFFPNTSGGIDALELTSGKLLWSNKDAARPLLATDNRLFAQKHEKANQIRVVVLDSTKEGKRVLETEPVVLPDWVVVTPTYGRTFRSGARLDANGLALAWEARAFYAGGARPTPQIEKAARKEASGVVRIDVATGKFEMLDKDKIAASGSVPFANEVNSVKMGDITLTLKDSPAKNAKNPFQRQRMLQADDAKGMVWQHEIAAPVFLPPLP